MARYPIGYDTKRWIQRAHQAGELLAAMVCPRHPKSSSCPQQCEHKTDKDNHALVLAAHGTTAEELQVLMRSPMSKGISIEQFKSVIRSAAS